MVDLIVRGGTVFDGTGAPAVIADVGISGERIAAVGDLSQTKAAREIAAGGCSVAPGFIDIHTHSDLSVIFHPEMESIISQGITTQIVGNCSLSVGLATNDPVFAFERRWLGAHGGKITWRDMKGHLHRVEEQGIATNYAMLAGQGTLRKRTIGMDNRPPTPEELEAMKRLLRDAMEQGCWGLSSGLEYTPSGYANVEELAELSSVLTDYGGIYASHLRNEGDRLVEAVEEAIEVGERAGVSVQISHHKAEGRGNWGKVHITLGMVDDARRSGLDVQLDQYPYTAFQTSMAVQFLPAWANVGTNEEMLRRLENPEERLRILADILANHADWDDLGPDSIWQKVEIGVCRNNRSLQGKTIAEIARTAGKGPVETVLDTILSERNLVSAINFAISEDDIAVVMRHPMTMIGSDAVGTCPRGSMGEDKVHPRSYGTFPRVLGRYVRDRRILSEAEAIRKMTAMPADRLGIRDRGRIEPGMFADLVIYNSKTIGDAATFENPHQFAVGIEAVIVNGSIVWLSGSPTGARPGKVLRKTEAASG